MPALPLVDVEQAAPAIRGLDAWLRREGFLRLERYPWPGSLKSLYHDPGILLRWLRGESNCWQASAFASAYYAWLSRFRPDLWTLCEAFMLCRPVAVERLEARLTKANCQRWREAGLLVRVNGSYASSVRATPWHGHLLWHDAPPGFRERWVFLGADSSTFARQLERWTRTRPTVRYRRALDLCTGAGIHACGLGAFADEVVGLDLNPRAVAYARLNAGLNAVPNASFAVSDLFEGVSGERFDLIVCNPPFLFLPPELHARCLDGNGGAMGMELVLRLIEGLPDHLTPDGTAILQANSPVVEGRDLLMDALRERLEGGRWQIQLTPTHEFQETAFYHLYTAHRIDRFVGYLIVLRAGRSFQLLRRSLTPWRKVACAIRIALVRAKGRRHMAGRMDAPTSSQAMTGPPAARDV